MSKEFIWHLDFEGDVKEFKCVLLENEVVTYEGDVEKDRLPITNPEVKQNVLQIDTTTEIFGKTARFQLERNIPYIKFGGGWLMSETTYEERKVKIVKTHKTVAYAEFGIGILMALACLIRYLIQGTMGNWWFLLVMASVIAATGWLQYREVKTQIKQLDEGTFDA